MVVTHLFQIMGFVAMEPPTALAPGRNHRGEEQGFRTMRPIDRGGWSAASTRATER